jgi:hypothetical protein
VLGAGAVAVDVGADAHAAVRTVSPQRVATRILEIEGIIEGPENEVREYENVIVAPLVGLSRAR